MSAHSTPDISVIEAYVRAEMAAVAGQPLAIGHGFLHVDRVRGRALQIAQGEGFERLDLVEAAALLHDIGLTHIQERTNHAHMGADLAAAYLPTLGCFTDTEVEMIASAIRRHSDVVPIAPIRGSSEGDALVSILREADILDALGPIGLMRAFSSKHTRLAYDPAGPRGATWSYTADDFTRLREKGCFPATTMIDQVNLQIAIFDNLRSKTAQTLGRPLVAAMRRFLVALSDQVSASTPGQLS